MDWQAAAKLQVYMKDYPRAVTFYDRALETYPEDAFLLIERLLVLLKIGPLSDEEMKGAEIMLLFTSEEARQKYRRGVNLGGMSLVESVEFLHHQALATENQSHRRFFVDLVLGALQTQGFWNSVDWHYKYAVMEKPWAPKAYYPPESFDPSVIKVKVKTVRGQNRGRGVVAIQDRIIAGERILKSKALTCIPFPCTETIELYDTWSPELIAGANQTLIDKLALRILEKFSMEPVLFEGFFDLWHGQNESPRFRSCKECFVFCGDLIKKIISLNGFAHWVSKSGGSDYESHSVHFGNVGMTLLRDGCSTASLGIWLLPGFMNHSCVNPNVGFVMNKDTMFLYALKDIRAGEELVYSYCPPNTPYALRQKLFDHHNFRCTCILCQTDEKETTTIHAQRANLLNQFFQNADIMDVEELEVIYTSIQNLRQSAPNLNYCLIKANEVLSSKWAQRPSSTLQVFRGNMVNACKYMDKSFELMYGTGLQSKVACLAVKAFVMSVGTGDKEEMKKWSLRIRNSVLFEHGHLKLVDNVIASNLKDTIPADRPNKLPYINLHLKLGNQLIRSFW